MHEDTLIDLLTNIPHWQFEIITHIVLDIVIVGIFYPAIKHLIKDHKHFHKND